MAIYIGDKNITEVAAGNALESAKQYADQGDASTLTQAKTYTNEREDSIRTDYTEADATTLQSAQEYADNNKVDKTAIGVAGGVAELDDNGLILSSQLPSYVDDVLEYDSQGSFPASGEAGKIYVAKDSNLTYRWSGSGYVEISPSLALGETSSTAYRGDRGKTAYDHSQIKNGNPHGTTFASLPDKPTSLPANGGNAESAVKDGSGNVITDSYFNAKRGPVTDLNKAVAFGLWSFNQGSLNVPEEITTSGIVFTYYSTVQPVNLIQMCTGYKNGVPTSWYVRNRTSYIAWSPWRKIWDSGNLTKLSQLQDDVVSGNYFKLSANRVANLNDTPINSFFVSSIGPSNSPVSYASYVNGFCVAADNNPTFKRQLVYADDWYMRSQSNGTWGEWNKLWHSGNLNPSDKLGVNDAAASVKDTSDNSSKKIWTGTQAEYDAISTKDSNTIYFIV